jgi:hypothetical protein
MPFFFFQKRVAISLKKMKKGTNTRVGRPVPQKIETKTDASAVPPLTRGEKKKNAHARGAPPKI